MGEGGTLFQDITSAKISCEGADTVVLIEVTGGLKASTLETLCACGRPVKGALGWAGVETVGSGVGDAKLGIERVFLSFLTGGERLPSCATGGFDDGCDVPFLNMAGGRKECTLMRERRFPWGY